MKLIVFQLILLLALNQVNAQPSATLKQSLYQIEDRIIAGDMVALKEIAKYLDDTTFVQEYLGYHNYPSSARRIAMRVLEENCLFKQNEFVFDSSTTSKSFSNLVNHNHVRFDPLTGAFLITTANERSVTYELKNLTNSELRHIDSSVIKFPFPNWYYENQIDWFLGKNDNQALLWIASAWYNKRPRFNRYYFPDNEFTDLMKKLTHLDIGVLNKNGQVDFLFNDDYYALTRLNYLIYWANHYEDYQWSYELHYFVNTKEKAKNKSLEEELFTFLIGKNDSLAIDAFTRLAEMDTTKVKRLADQYEFKNLDRNNKLPTFPFRFLKQLTVFTSFCRTNGISYYPTGWLLDSLNRLKTSMPFADRYCLENNIVGKLHPEQVAMVEYFGLINEIDWDATYSIGRILDKFYSCKWAEFTNNKTQFAFFLKKSLLFDNLGIIGLCNRFLVKFTNCSPSVLSVVADLSKTSDDPASRRLAKFWHFIQSACPHQRPYSKNGRATAKLMAFHILKKNMTASAYTQRKTTYQIIQKSNF